MTPAVTALVAALAAAGLTGLLLNKKADATQILSPDGNVIASVPDNLVLKQIEENTKDKTYRVVKAYLKRSATTATSRPTQANQSLSVTGFKVLNISMIFDANFKLAGIFDLVINGSTFLQISAADLTDTDQFSMDLFTNGWKIDDFQTIELYAWTSNASNCAVTLSATLGI